MREDSCTVSQVPSRLLLPAKPERELLLGQQDLFRCDSTRSGSFQIFRATGFAFDLVLSAQRNFLRSGVVSPLRIINPLLKFPKPEIKIMPTRIR